MKKFIQNNWFILIILSLGFILRFYKLKELFLYTHDQDLAGWFIKDVILNKHLRLIGQETSTEGIFIGPLFYYLLIPFYLFTGMDPIGGTFLTLLLGLFTIYSFYFVFTKIFNKKTGIIAAIFYAVSFYTVFNDREVVPTMPVILWTVWFLYALNLILTGKQKIAYPFTGFLLSLTWHLNVSLVLLSPLIIIVQYLSHTKIKLKYLIWGIAVLLITSLPFVFFELRHGFPQLNSLRTALFTNQHDIVSGKEKVERTFHLFSKNIHNLLWGDYGKFGYNTDLLLFSVTLIILFLNKILRNKMLIIFLCWISIYLLFFSLYSKRLSEYYLNGLIVMFVGVFSLLIAYLLNNRRLRLIGFLSIIAFISINIMRIINTTINRSGYLERKAIVNEIKADAGIKNYQCVSVSYITNPGYNLGYRYFLWLAGVKLKPISDKVPVYTIVYPQKPIFKTDKDFGAIGLIYPDYARYKKSVIEESCRGDDFNLKEPMIGFPD